MHPFNFSFLTSTLLAGCLVPATSPPAAYGDQPEPYTPSSEPSPSPSPSPEPVYYDEPGYDTVDVDVVGQPVGTIDVFFDQLDPYGTWYDDPTYGWVFTPSQPSYVPYSNGYWKYTDYGLLWVSNDPFGWATDHYGRWVYHNRWLWTPDLTWGPAWVSWRQGDGWIGWAAAGYTADPYIPEAHWRFVLAPHLFSVDIHRRYIRDNRAYLHSSVPIVRYRRHGNDEWVAGPTCSGSPPNSGDSSTSAADRTRSASSSRSGGAGTRRRRGAPGPTRSVGGSTRRGANSPSGGGGTMRASAGRGPICSGASRRTSAAAKKQRSSSVPNMSV